MALEIHGGDRPSGGLVSDRRLYLTSDKEQVVEDGDPRAAFLFATEGFEIQAVEVERYGLTSVDGRVVIHGATPAAAAEPKTSVEGEVPAAEAPSTDEGATEAPKRGKRGRSGGS